GSGNSLIRKWERGTEDLNSVDSDSRPSINFYKILDISTWSMGRNKIVGNRIPQCIRIGRQMKANQEINHHPPLRPPGFPPLNVHRKNPLVAPTSVSFSPASILQHRQIHDSHESKYNHLAGASTSIALATHPHRAAFGI
ncbi:hypothetical protein N7517_005454, partial [Penicillium concentricum]